MRRPSSTVLLGGLGLLFTGGVLVGTVLLPRAQDRSSEADHVTEGEPMRRVPADPASTLQQQVPHGSAPPSAPARPGLRARAGASRRATPPPQPTLVKQVRVVPAEESHSVVDGRALRRAIEEVEETFSPMVPQLSEALSDHPGMGVRVSWEAGTAALDRQGFTLTDLDPHQSFGLEAGDTIASVNGHPVDGLPGAWWIFHSLKNHDLTELRLEILRGGARLYETYRIVGR